MTEIKGSYEVDLAWTQEEAPRDPGDSKANETPDGPTIFTALQEKMGLKLEARKAPMDIIVVDHAEKVPSEN
jgi:uncharacterized protein (TIGR03435 family)